MLAKSVKIIFGCGAPVLVGLGAATDSAGFCGLGGFGLFAIRPSFDPRLVWNYFYYTPVCELVRLGVGILGDLAQVIVG